jgi:leucyl/phenylalanyl-tRNA---protein transferase
MQLVLTDSLLIEAYKQGLFPMAYNAESPYIQWICPEFRGQLDIKNLHIPRSLKKEINKTIRSDNISVTINQDFEKVITLCGTPDSKRPETWINSSIRDAFISLHKSGYAHSVEYREKSVLKGGLYGLALGSAFFGESMVSLAPNASKIALIHLAARLWRGGFTLLDTQFTNAHLEQFGVYELPHHDYIKRLNRALCKPADFILKGIPSRDLIQSYLTMRDGTHVIE